MTGRYSDSQGGLEPIRLIFAHNLPYAPRKCVGSPRSLAGVDRESVEVAYLLTDEIVNLVAAGHQIGSKSGTLGSGVESPKPDSEKYGRSALLEAVKYRIGDTRYEVDSYNMSTCCSGLRIVISQVVSSECQRTANSRSGGTEAVLNGHLVLREGSPCAGVDNRKGAADEARTVPRASGPPFSIL